jgi:chloride channel protein, CIC family
VDVSEPNEGRRWQFLSGLGDQVRARRWHRMLLLSALTGAVTGLAVAGFEWLTARTLLDWVFGLPRAAQVVAPGIGLILAWALLRWCGHRASPSTSDEYLRAYHDPDHPFETRPFAGRVLASIATLGLGGAMGFEGPSIFMGAGIGSWLERRFGRYLTKDDARLLLVAGAAAGVSAIFKAPATGAIFAIEVPFQEDTAAHALLPALVGSATSYLTYVAFYGTTPLFGISGQPHLDATRLLGALGLGILAGLGARGFSFLLRAAKTHGARRSVWSRLAVSGLGLAAVTTIGFVIFNDGLTLGPGYQAITWTLDPKRAVALIAALFVLRALATVLTVGGGGAGGVFIPLFVQGWLLGRFVEAVAGTHTSLFPVVGAAAFLGAGYRTPIAGIVFVAEATGRPGFIVPALIATAVAQVLMGTSSVTTYQRVRRQLAPGTPE